MLTHDEFTRFKRQMEAHEGKRGTVYVDSVGKVSIGIGRNLDDVGMSEDEITLFFLNDVARAEHLLSTMLPWAAQLDEIRYRVLLDMAFNMGGRLLQFKQTLSSIKRGDYSEAASLMLQSKWATQVKSRAIRLAAMMRTGKEAPEWAAPEP